MKFNELHELLLIEAQLNSKTRNFVKANLNKLSGKELADTLGGNATPKNAHKIAKDNFEDLPYQVIARLTKMLQAHFNKKSKDLQFNNKIPSDPIKRAAYYIYKKYPETKVIDPPSMNKGLIGGPLDVILDTQGIIIGLRGDFKKYFDIIIFDKEDRRRTLEIISSKSFNNAMQVANEVKKLIKKHGKQNIKLQVFSYFHKAIQRLAKKRNIKLTNKTKIKTNILDPWPYYEIGDEVLTGMIAHEDDESKNKSSYGAQIYLGHKREKNTTYKQNFKFNKNESLSKLKSKIYGYVNDALTAYENIDENNLYEEGIGKTIGKGLLSVALGMSTPTAAANKAKKEIKQQQKVEKQVKSRDDIMLNLAKKYIGKHEGIRKKIYKDSKGNPTIGIGHLIKPGEDFSKGITDEEVTALFKKDIQERLKVTKKLFPAFNTYPPYMQVTLLDGVYRGDLSGSPKTIKLIKAGKWVEASKEYLNNREYKKSVKDGTGVHKRMEENATRMKHYGERLNKTGK